MEPVCQVRLTKMHPPRRGVHALPPAIGPINIAFRGKERERPDGAGPNASQKRIQWEVTLRSRALVGGVPQLGGTWGKIVLCSFSILLGSEHFGAFAEAGA